MSDNQTPETITIWQSGIIQKQLAILVPSICTFIYAICSLFGIVVTPDLQAKIAAAVMALLVMILAIWTIHNRITKACQPIATKQPPGV